MGCDFVSCKYLTFLCVCVCVYLQLISSGVSEYQHTSVTLEFFETVVRYDKFFIVEPQHIPSVLVSLCVYVCVHTHTLQSSCCK